MPLIFRRIVTLAAVALGLSAAHTAQAQTAYGLAGSGTTLVRFDLATPGATTFIGSLSGATTSLNDIDFRVSNGLLYGYSQATNQIVTINTANALTTFVANPSTGASLDFVAVDFNPAADRLRLVSPNRQNLRVNTAGGATIVDGTLTYASGDANANTTPFISDTAYTNNDNDPATGTTIYYIDSNLHTLVTSANPNGGVLNTVGALGATSNNEGGFDIYTGSNGLNSAYAIMDDGANAGLYSINLGTGAATLRGDINAAGSFFGFAIVPAATAVPEPGSVALFVSMGITGAGFLARRKCSRHSA